MAGEVVHRLFVSMKARNFNVFNKPMGQKHAPRFKYIWNIK